MKLGLFTPVFAKLDFGQLLTELKRYPLITRLELGCGGWPGSSHIDPTALLAGGEAAREYRARLSDAGLSISALSCHGNPVHPDAAIAKRDNAIFEQTLRLAERLEVANVVTLLRLPWRRTARRNPQLDHRRMAPGVQRVPGVAVDGAADSLLA